jgi:predicted MFS family arabinose efflux permease
MHTRSKSRKRLSARWWAVAAFFLFMLLHQTDRLLIGPLTTPIMQTFGIDEAQMGAVFTGALLAGALLYPVWGYLYDRFARARLLALASFLWGATTWLSALAPTYPAFLASRASTGIDDSSYPGIYSLISDYFGPAVRGKIYGLLQLTMPLGYMLGLGLAYGVGTAIGWRAVFYLTGALGIALSIVILIVVREPVRGQGEPELAGLAGAGSPRFDRRVALRLFKKRSLLLLFAQGFFGVFPWNVIAYWFFRYLEVERGYAPGEVLGTMAVAVVALASGYFLGGAAGDWLFKRTPRGRLMVSAVAVLAGAALLPITLGVPFENRWMFLAMLCLNAVLIPFASPNVVSTVYDVTLPEVRSTALAIQSFIEEIGSASAPLLAGIIAVSASLGQAILVICVTAWLVCGVIFVFAAYVVPRDMVMLRAQLRERAALAITPSVDSPVPLTPESTSI